MFRRSIVSDFGGQSQTSIALKVHVLWGKFDAGRHGQTLTKAKLAEVVSAHLQAYIVFPSLFNSSSLRP
jgi:hypothetical protein